MVSPDGWNASQFDVILVAVTSQMTMISDPGTVSLLPADLLAAGLPKPSRVRTTKLFTMHQILLRRTLGHLPNATMETVLLELRRLFS